MLSIAGLRREDNVSYDLKPRYYILIFSKTVVSPHPFNLTVRSLPSGNFSYTVNLFALTVFTHPRDFHGHYFETTTTIFPFALPVFNFA